MIAGYFGELCKQKKAKVNCSNGVGIERFRKSHVSETGNQKIFISNNFGCVTLSFIFFLNSSTSKSSGIS